jgi:type I restriction-modification system DNA methylase subunit
LRTTDIEAVKQAFRKFASGISPDISDWRNISDDMIEEFRERAKKNRNVPNSIALSGISPTTYAGALTAGILISMSSAYFFTDTYENLNETLEKIFNSLEASAQGTDSEDDLKGLFDDIDVNSNKLGVTVAKRNEKLVKLLGGVADMKLSGSETADYKENTIDVFGDANPLLNNDPRFSPAGVLAPKSKADLTFIMHSLS